MEMLYLKKLPDLIVKTSIKNKKVLQRNVSCPELDRLQKEFANIQVANRMYNDNVFDSRAFLKIDKQKNYI